jgi:hypothetical protein
VSKYLARGRSADDIRRYAAVKRGIAFGGAMPDDATVPDDATLDDAPPLPPPLTPGEFEQVAEARSRAFELEDAKLRRSRALAEGSEIENMVRRGELLPVPYVTKWVTRYLIDGRDELLRLPSELADELAGESDPVKVRRILEAATDRVIKKFEQLYSLWQKDAEAKVA